jgi:hypothetical protein
MDAENTCRAVMRSKDEVQKSGERMQSKDEQKGRSAGMRTKDGEAG